jgi:hypothetical protein
MDAGLTFQATKQASIIFNIDNLLDRWYRQYYLAQGRSVFAGLRLRFN